MSSPLPPPTQFPTLTPDTTVQLPHDDFGPRLNGIIWSLAAASATFLFTRVYFKVSRHRGLGWDDYVLVAAWIALVIQAGFTSAMISDGYGKHTWDIPIKDFAKILLLANIGGTFLIFAAVWSKTSFAITLLRLLRDTEGWTKVIIWCIIVTMNVIMHLSALFLWIQCTPVQKSWNPLIEGKCPYIDTLNNYIVFSAAYSGAMDVVLALLPWKLIWKLQMRKEEKFGVAIAMSMGIFAGVTAMIKVTQIPTMKAGDIYNNIQLAIWSNAECSVTIMAASVPILRLLVKSKDQAPPPYMPEPAAGNNNSGFYNRSLGIRTMDTSTMLSTRLSRTSWLTWKQQDREEKGLSYDDPVDPKIILTTQVVVEYDEKKPETKPADVGRAM